MNRISKSFHALSSALLILVFLALPACVAAPASPTQGTPQGTAGIANPASQNCIQQGGKLSIQTRGDGGQYGVCLFEDNRGCEEWALLHGDCPAGGVKITGYVTPAAQYCAITGGRYAVTGEEDTENEQGTCTFKDGSHCDAWAYYNGTCTPGSAVEATPQGVGAGQRVLLQEALGSLAPREVWRNFYDVTQVPRPSGHEEQVREFLVQFGQELDLETIVDEVGNVIIRKPASPGMENRKGVILQAHMDMVPQKTPETVHDFTTDPISAYVDGGWVRADGTTLGADDGIGLAMAMAVLQSQTLAAGPLEALFTVDEEQGLTGASGLKPGLLQGDTLINLDSETEGAFTIGSAGGEDAVVQTSYAQTATPDGMAAYRVTVQGLTGGHSGVDIDRGRGHAARLLVRLLRESASAYGVRVAELSGGTADNAIPREATALVCLPEAQSAAFLVYLPAFEAIVQEELAAVEPGLSVGAEPASPPAQVMDEGAQRRIIAALYGAPQGVLRMSDAAPGLVETSTNLGIVQAMDGQLEVMYLSRSSVDSALDDAGAMIASIWELAGMQVELTGRYPGWRPDAGSPVLELMQAAYQELYGQEAGVVALHAGLETSVIGAAYPDLDMISIGPTLVDVHTPDERLEIASVQKVYDLLLATLGRIPEK